MAKTLAAGFPDIDHLMSATEEELMSLPDVGPRIAASVREYFRDPENIEIIKRLKAAGMEFNAGESIVAGRALSGKTFVISGTFANHTREEIKSIIESNGGKVASSVTGNTSFVIAGSDMGPAKRQKAETLGIKIKSEEDLIEMIKDFNPLKGDN